MTLSIHFGVVALLAANLSIFIRERGRPNYVALVLTNITVIAIGAMILSVVSALFEV